MPSILLPIDVMRMGLGYVGIDLALQAKMSVQDKVDEFKAHFGLCHTSIQEAQLEEKEMSEKGFKWYMIAHFFLWTYPQALSGKQRAVVLAKEDRSFEEEEIVWSSDLQWTMM